MPVKLNLKQEHIGSPYLSSHMDLVSCPDGNIHGQKYPDRILTHASIPVSSCPPSHTSPSSYSAAPANTTSNPSIRQTGMHLVAAHLKMANAATKFSSTPNIPGMLFSQSQNILHPMCPVDPSNSYSKSHLPDYKSHLQSESYGSAAAPLVHESHDANIFNNSSIPNSEFNWKPIGVNSADYLPSPLAFDSPTGATNSSRDETPLQIFRRLLDEELVAMIIEEMNAFGRKIVNEEIIVGPKKKKPKGEPGCAKKPTEWVEIDSREFWSFMACMFYMSVVKIPSIKRYWNKDLWGQPTVQELMNRDRFCTLLRCLEFADITDPSATDYPSLSRISPLLEKMCSNFREQYNPDSQLCLERTLLQSNGKFKYKYPLEDEDSSGSVGVKSYILCEAKTGYVLDFFVNSGRSSNFSSDLGDKMRNPSYLDLAACKLVTPFQGKGHTLFTDGYYTNPLLFAYLKKEADIECVGVTHSNAEHFPDVIKPGNAQITKGEVVNMLGQVNQTYVLAQTWRIKEEDPPRYILMLSTKHPPNTKVVAQKHKGYLHKPVSYLEYHEFEGAIEKVDQTCTQLPGEEGPVSKFPYKIFLRFVNLALHNAFVIWRSFDPKANLGYGTNFRLQLMKELKLEFDELKRQIAIMRRQQASDVVAHELTKTAGISSAGKRRARKRCIHCWNVKGKRSQTSHECKGCDQGFCPPCFNEYHSKLKLL